MSERAPSAPEPADQEPATQEADSEPVEKPTLESKPRAYKPPEELVIGGETINPSADQPNDSEPAAPAPKERPALALETNPIELTAEEQNTKVILEGLTTRRINGRERAVPIFNTVHKSYDKTRNIRDVAVKKATLIEFREGAKTRKAARLEARLNKARPGSIRHRRLSMKYGKTNIKLGDTRSRLNRLNGASDTRAQEYQRTMKARQKEIQLRRGLLKIDKKVAAEKKARRNLQRDMRKASNEMQRVWLKQDMDSRPSISDFRQKLVDEAMKKYKTKQGVLGKKKDYELAA